MKNYTDEEVLTIGKDLYGSDFDGDVRTSLTSGKHKIREIGKPIPHNMGRGGKWYPVLFTDGQSCSLKTLLRCPNIKWTSNSLKKRIEALDGLELDVKRISEESVKPSDGEPYKRKVINLVSDINV